MGADAPARVQRLALLGCGLMGGSFALALKDAGAVGTVVGHSRQRHTTEEALALGVVDAVAASAAEAVEGADVVLVAVPVTATEGVLRALRPALGPEALVMDVGSTKRDVVAAARAALGDRVAQFVPAHPIAGKSSGGVAQAEAALYRQRHAVLTPLPDHTEGLLGRAQALWKPWAAGWCAWTPTTTTPPSRR